MRLAIFLTFPVLQKEKEWPELSSQQSYVISNPLQNSSKTSNLSKVSNELGLQFSDQNLWQVGMTEETVVYPSIGLISFILLSHLQILWLQHQHPFTSYFKIVNDLYCSSEIKLVDFTFSPVKLRDNIKKEIQNLLEWTIFLIHSVNMFSIIYLQLV